jgi:hypothetical protein
MENHQNPLHKHLPEDHFHKLSHRRPDTVDEPLYVITPIFNPQRFRKRWSLYKEFEKSVLDAGAYLVTIECSFGARQEVLTEQRTDRHLVINVYTENELWLKENLINLAVQRLPRTAKYIAWVDADIKFVRSDWVGETIHKLQHYHVVQMFSVAYDLTPGFVPYQINYGFVHDYINGVQDKAKNKKWADDDTYYGNGGTGSTDQVKTVRFHPGFAWAYTVEAWNALGGLIDFAILGSADMHMARALVGQFEKSCPANIHKEYKEAVRLWQERALEFVKKDIGYVDGKIDHFFHGSKKHRNYKGRWKILVDNQYNPKIDLKRFFNGTWQLEDHRINLRDDIRNYFRARNEDSVDLQPNEKPIGL